MRRAGVVAQVDAAQPDALDTHPLVREHLAEQLKGKKLQAWREDNGRLCEQYRDVAKR